LTAKDPQKFYPLGLPGFTLPCKEPHKHMPLCFIRHGESGANEQNRFAGRLDSPLALPGTHATHTLTALGPALLTYAVVLVAALAVPGAAAQALRRRDPIRAGALSTNWNWLGGLPWSPSRVWRPSRSPRRWA